MGETGESHAHVNIPASTSPIRPVSPRANVKLLATSSHTQSIPQAAEIGSPRLNSKVAMSRMAQELEVKLTAANEERQLKEERIEAAEKAKRDEKGGL